MSRILAIDWDGVEARFALGTVLKDRLIVLNVGAAAIAEAVDAATDVVSEDAENDEEDEQQVWDGDEDEDDGAEVVETVEKKFIPKTPVAYDEDEEEEPLPDGGVVVSTVKKSKRESFKTSPLALTLKKLLRENKVGSATICYSLERGDVDMTYMTIPQTTEAETPEIVFNQALRDSLTFNETQPIDYMPLGLSTVKRGVRRVAAASIARDKLRRIRETLIGAIHAPSKIELREPSLAEFLRADFCGLKYEDPVLLIQELCDEVNLTLCVGKDVLYFRSFKLQADASPAIRAERIKEEVLRTLIVGVDDLPENTEVNQAIYFTSESKPRPVAIYDGENEDEGQEVVGAYARLDESATTATRLAILLDESGVNVDFINPFKLPGVKMKTPEPEFAGRYASSLGMLLAERPGNKPAIDLLHPHEKPKPPNYALVFVLYFVLVGIAAAAVWQWNKNQLKTLKGEIATLETEYNEATQEMRTKQPLYLTLSTANNWINNQGVIVLDEMRDIMMRLPKSPDLIVQRLAYLGDLNGKPAFVISAKITSVEVYQQFLAQMTANNAHQVQSARGAVANEGDPGYKYMFSANIICWRRVPGAFVSMLPAEVREINEKRPEYFVQQEEERARQLKEEQDKFLAGLQLTLDKSDEIVASTAPRQDDNGQPLEPTLDEDKANGLKLEQMNAELNDAYQQAAAALQQGKIAQEQAADFVKRYQEKRTAIAQAYQPIAARVQAAAQAEARKKAEEEARAAEEARKAAEEEARKAAEEARKAAEEEASKAAEAQQAQAAENGEAQAQEGAQANADAQNQNPNSPEARLAFWKEQDGANTAEQDETLQKNLLAYRANIDASFQQAQVQAQQGAIQAPQFAQFQQRYQAEVINVVARWNALQERVKARQEGSASAEQPAEATPAEPAPAEQPAEAAPAEPAPAEQPAEAAPAEPASAEQPAEAAPAESVPAEQHAEAAPAEPAPAEQPAAFNDNNTNVYVAFASVASRLQMEA